MTVSWQAAVIGVLELEDHGSVRLRFGSESLGIEITAIQTVADRDSIVRIEFRPHKESNGCDEESEVHMAET